MDSHSGPNGTNPRSDSRDLSRRRALLGLVGMAAVAGCVGNSGPGAPRASGEPTPTDATETPSSQRTDTPDTDVSADDLPPLSDSGRHVPHEFSSIRDSVLHGGVPKDGIPPIEDPDFVAADHIEDAPLELDPEDVVFGLERNGEVKAYPQHVVVWHEIVNDEIGGDPVSVTYCPLTGTAQGFERGDTSFGVSGRLVNSNLIMYDRGTDNWWPQLFATGLTEPVRGLTLQEFRVVWTTWERWQEAHPDTLVLTEDTGFERRYHDDPYGGYNPREGYYDFGGPMFDVMADDEDGQLADKEVVVGSRTPDGAIAFRKDRLLDERLLAGDLAGTRHVAVADPELETAYVYAAPEGREFTPVEEGYEVDGEVHDPDALPLERRLAFDAMWFAWYACYPDTTFVPE